LWTGIIIGIFIGIALGILLVSMAISAKNSSEQGDFSQLNQMESSEELVPDIHRNIKNQEQIKKQKEE